MILALSTAAAAVASLAVLIVPGLPLVLGIRMHPLARAALVAPVSVVVVTVAAELGRLLGVPWSPLSPLVIGLLLGAPLLVREHRRRPRTGTAAHRGSRREALGAATARAGYFASSRGRLVAVVAGLTIGAAVIVARAVTMMGSIDAVSQTYDGVFHLNAVRWVMDQGDASAWSVGSMTSLPGEASYYPAAWHQLASLVVMTSGGDVVLGSNVLMLTVAALVWPVGLVAMVRLSTTAGSLGLFLAGALSGLSVAFPLTLMSWGIVLPNFLSTALLPAFVLLGTHVLGLVPHPRERLSTAALVLLVPVVCVAIIVAHPQGVFAAIALGLPIIVWAFQLRLAQLEPARGGWAPLLITAAHLVVGIGVASYVWPRFRPSQESSVWTPNASGLEAVQQGLSLAGNAARPVHTIGVLMVLAIIGVLLRGQARWLLPAFAVTFWIFTAAVSMQRLELRYLITGPWYSDNYRIAAIMVVAGIPLLAVGLDSLVTVALERFRGLPLQKAAAAVTATALAAGILAVGTLTPAARQAVHAMAFHWQNDELLTEDERLLLEMLPEVVPPDAVIATNPWNGSSLAYAISDRPVLNTFMGFQAEEEVHLLNRSLDEAHQRPVVCTAADELGVEYALDFGPDEIWQQESTYEGLDDISTSGAAEVVLEVGDAALLELEPCRGTDGSILE